MNIHRATALALVVAVLLAGCSSLDQLTGPSPTESTPATTSPPTTTTATDTTTTTTATPSPTATTYVETPPPTTTTAVTTTQTATWTEPEPPHQPTEAKNEDRITDGEFINRVEASNGNGYTNFDVRVGADTWMEDIDPPDDVDGEPYFIVEINGERVARSDIVPFRQEGSFTIEIKPAALQQFDSGTLDVRVVLLDVDKKYDDLYGTWTGTIEYENTNESG